MDWHYVLELVKSIRNRCTVIQILALDWDDEVEVLMPTLLEDILQDAQDAVDEGCVIDAEDVESTTSTDAVDDSLTDGTTYKGQSTISYQDYRKERYAEGI